VVRVVRQCPWVQNKTTAAIKCINDKITVTSVVVNQCSHDTIHDLINRSHVFVHSNVQSNLEDYLAGSFNRRLVSRSIPLLLEWESFNTYIIAAIVN
jgi:hypothetical protein